MSLDTPRTRYGLALLALPFVASLALPAAAQTAPATQPAAAEAPSSDKPAEPHKSKRLDKHAGPWTVIWNTRLWTDVPPTQDFVKATHPDPKSLEYTPLVGKEPKRPKPRDAAGIAALQAELEGDIKSNEIRGKAVNDVGAPKKAEKPRRAKRTAKASAAKAPKPD